MTEPKVETSQPLPEGHALYGVTTKVIETEDNNALLPSLVEFYRPDRDGRTDPFCCGRLMFQNGPIKEHGVNGIGIEHLLHLVATRLRGYQATEFACANNQLALNYTLNAILALERRTKDRQDRGVEGTSEQ